jgi:hypothetical protein
MSEQSTNEGQPDPTLEPVLEPEEANETPGNLEPENNENLLQNLENAQSAVAPMVALDGDPKRQCTVPHEAGRNAR